jgi:hypothetical protein
MNGHRQLFGSDPELRTSGSDQLTCGLPTTLKLIARPHARVVYFFSVSNHLMTIDCSSMRRSEKL